VTRRLIALAAVAFALDVAGATWGLPARWHPDEKADAAARMVSERTLAPDSFINPTLSVYAMAPAVALQQGLAAAGVLSGRAADPLLAGRIVGALAAAAAVLVTGLALMRFSRAIGLLAAAFLAVMPGAVNLAHFATPEPWLLLTAALTLLAASRHADGRAPAWAVGVALGLAGATKYTAAALAVPCAIAGLLRRRETKTEDAPAMAAAGLIALAAGGVLVSDWGAAMAAALHLRDSRLLDPARAAAFVSRMGVVLAVGGGVCLAVAGLAARGVPAAVRLARYELPVMGAAALAAFLAATPYAIVEPRAFLSDLAFNDQTRFEYKGLAGEASSYRAYQRLAAEALTTPMFLATVTGLIVACARAAQRDRKSAVLAAAVVAPYLLVAGSGHQAMRFLAPAFPAAAGLAALGLLSMPSVPIRRVAAGLVLARAALASLLVVRLFFVDSRARATRWMEAHVPPGAAIDLIANNPGYAPAAPAGRTLRIVPTLSREMAPAARFEEAAARYPAESAEWLVLTASYYERFLDHPAQHPERARFFRTLLDGRGGFEVAARFRQEGWKRPEAEFVDPEIVVLRRARGKGL
jgi:hypothetical protein